MALIDIDFNVGVILPAGGTGERMNLPYPKQYNIISERPLIFYTVDAFHRLVWIKYIIVTVSEAYITWMKEFVNQYDFYKVKVEIGAETRHQSIYNGIKAISSVCDKPDVILIHDAVRILAEEDLVKTIAVAAKIHGAAGVTRPLVSTVVSVDPNKHLLECLDRSLYQASEMPQAFRYDIIKHAYEQCTFDDFLYGTECLLLAMKYSNVKAQIIEGNSSLWKVTNKKDLYAAEGILKEKFIKAYLMNVPKDKEIFSIFNKCFQEKNLQLSLSKSDEISCSSSVFTSIIQFVDVDDNKNIPALFSKYTNQVIENTQTSKHKRILLHVCVMKSKEEIVASFPVLSTKYKKYCHELQNSDICNLIIALDCHEEQLARMCVDIIWNRSESLTGQILTIY